MTESQPSPHDLSSGELDERSLEALFDDLAQTELLSVNVKHGAEQLARGCEAGANARELLLHGNAQGIQLRYRYAGEEWIDTIMRSGSGFRLFRIRVPLS